MEFKGLFHNIYAKYGYDFRNYSKASLKRRVDWRMHKERIPCLETFRNRVLDDETLFSRLVDDLLIGVTQMFRDPSFFKHLREKILPALAPFPHIRIWSAGTSTGEEAYSLAILLEEAGLYERSLIYATDLSDPRLKRAAEGHISMRNMARNTSNYYSSGGVKPFSQYFEITEDHAVIDPYFRKNLVFSTHCLANDWVFNEFHLILCRNVLIYFDPHLGARALSLFTESLTKRGFLCLGSKESLISFQVRDFYEKAHHSEKVYRKLF
ncbi:MAG: CheR family methyltransferase [Acidobacteriota bacterium]|nr:CheR family methyltransferase [Acidobacteriota bacterium]